MISTEEIIDELTRCLIPRLSAIALTHFEEGLDVPMYQPRLADKMYVDRLREANGPSPLLARRREEGVERRQDRSDWERVGELLEELRRRG